MDDAGLAGAVDATVAAGTAYYELLLESEPAGIVRTRSQGVCDFARRRAATHTVTEVPEGVPDQFQITDGGVVHSTESGDEWYALDMGGWGAASLLAVLGWLYGAVDARSGDDGERTVTMSARRALETCPASLRPELATAFGQSGHLEAVATGRVRTDAANRVTGFRLDLPYSRDGLFGSLDVGSRTVLTLSGFGEPADIRPPDSGPVQPVGEFVERLLRADESE
jgi:hypothetical protein